MKLNIFFLFHIERYHEQRNVENCPYCHKQYSRLKAHLETCESGPSERKRYFCSYCNKSWKHKCNLNKHMKDYH